MDVTANCSVYNFTADPKLRFVARLNWLPKRYKRRIFDPSKVGFYTDNNNRIYNMEIPFRYNNNVRYLRTIVISAAFISGIGIITKLWQKNKPFTFKNYNPEWNNNKNNYWISIKKYNYLFWRTYSTSKKF